MDTSYKITKCRMCDSANLEEYLTLGHQPPSDAFITEEQRSDSINTYPLNVVVCHDCGLSQLDYVVDPKILYQQDYPYEASTTETGRRHYWEFAKAIVDRFNLKSEDIVIDIGSNVGVLLEGFQNNGVKVLGIDPAPNIVAKANTRGIRTVCDFFGLEAAKNLPKNTNGDFGAPNSISVIVGTNVFAHVDNLNSFMKAVQYLLKDDGIFIFESPSLKELIKNNAYSSVYHEHLSYLSLMPVSRFVGKFGMEVFDVEHQDIHEGSFRVFIGKSGKHKISENVDKYIKEEFEVGAYNINKLDEFAAKAYKHLDELDFMIRGLAREGKKIVLLSAPAKGMTIVSTLGWKNNTIYFATDKSPLKIGKYCPGGSIPILSDDALLKENIDYAAILAWNFQREIVKNNQEYLKRGGKFIQLFPEIKIIDSYTGEA